MLKDEGLKACLCGGEGLLIEHRLVKYPNYRYFTVGCGGNCQTETEEFETPEQATAAWDRRPADQTK